MAAGLRTLQLLQEPGFHQRLGQQTEKLCAGLVQVAQEAAVPLFITQVPGMFGLFFTAQTVRSFADVMAADKERYARFFHLLLAEGVYLAPSAYEAGFVSAAHDDAIIDATISAARKALQQL
jgi:glutamate-1-semialdehyde 2,1-aminomutase